MSSLYISLVLLLSLSSALGNPQAVVNKNKLSGEGSTIQKSRDFYECLSGDGDFEDQFQCDKYWHCKHGVAEARLCGDGLVFDKFKADGRIDPCDSAHVVDCTGKPELQPASHPNQYCLRAHGLFPHPDPTVCNIFYTCTQGAPTKKVCTNGLHYTLDSQICNWPASANRKGCAEKKPASINGFVCPREKVVNQNNQVVPHPNYPNVDDCQKFYTCLLGVTPREAVCNLGQVFNERSGMCDYPEFVPECDGWYKNDPRFAQDYIYDDDLPLDAADPAIL